MDGAGVDTAARLCTAAWAIESTTPSHKSEEVGEQSRPKRLGATGLSEDRGANAGPDVGVYSDTRSKQVSSREMYDGHER